MSSNTNTEKKKKKQTNKPHTFPVLDYLFKDAGTAKTALEDRRK
jgi:hypothetical protein